MKNFIRHSLRGLCVAFSAAALCTSSTFAAAGDLYSGGIGDNVVYKFTPAGVRTVFANVLLADAVAFDKKGNLFVSSRLQSNPDFGSIIEITPGGTQTTVGSGPRKVVGLAFDAVGNLYDAETSETFGNAVTKVPPAGPPTDYALAAQPLGLAVDRAGNLFVSLINNTVIKIAPNGTQSTFVAPSAGLQTPEGLAVDNNGNLYVASSGNGKVYQFNPAGVQTTFATGLSGPRNIAIDQNGNVYVANDGTREILKFGPNGGTPVVFASDTNAGGLAFEPATGILTNISTRASVKTGSGVTIGGFIVSGTDSKTVVLRGLGPTLAGAGVTGVLADPTLQLFDGTGNPLWFNDNWKDTQQAQIQARGLAPPNDLESAILQILQPGNYTVILSGKNGTTGVGLVEVYDISPGVFAELTNVSTRGFVGSGQSVMIGGFINSGGNGSTQVVIRGLGPTLAQLGVSGALANPVVTLVNGNGVVVKTNDDWKNTQQAAIEATGLAPPNDLESAMVVTVAAGNYTAILSGSGGGTGIGLVEVYKL